MDNNFINYIRAGYSMLVVKTYEEFRVLRDYMDQLSRVTVKSGTNNIKYKAFSWDIVKGVQGLSIENGVLQHTSESLKVGDQPTEMDPLLPLKYLDEEAGEASILFLKDYHPFLEKDYKDSTLLIRTIRNLSSAFKSQRKCLVFLSPEFTIPHELTKDIAVIDFKLPEKAELKIVLEHLSTSCGVTMPKGNNLDAILDAALGMTAIEAENAFSVSLIEAKKISADVVRREKSQVVKKGGKLEVIETSETIDDAGGVEIVKDWIVNRKNCFTPEARAFGVKPPRAILFLGIAGCGKSLLAKIIASVLNRPLLRLDMSNIMDKWVGGSEGNMKAALDTAEAVSPSILWLDEIEKGLAGNSGGQEGHEVTRKVFGMLLTWMQEKTKDVILVATANSISALPPELISRFSQTFWVDLPDAAQRKDIIKIHLKKAGRSPTLFNDAELDEVVALTDDFNGRELEGAVQDSVTRAFSKGHAQVQLEDLKEAMLDVTPISRIKKAKLDEIRTDVRAMGIKNASRVQASGSVQVQTTRKVTVEP